jgi:hypothetical protein
VALLLLERVDTIVGRGCWRWMAGGEERKRRVVGSGWLADLFE